ncbi:BURP domain-containing protein 12-like [Hordeum vulgare subsp. vulgare]|uniref:BURP domain-containing protein n=1 Tax=Hordeum vulgare subsp. vulgare TaxID=112509 RepID=A0A8I6YIP5_HORVV|nr:BURP domain-containing protein 12-like [Hordeum vulgare subsp. vulgare]
MASPPRPVLTALLLALLLLPPGNASGAASVNPFTAKAAFIRYWNRKVPNNRPHPAFFVSKLSPLPAADAASFPSSLPDIRARLPTLCSKAALLCPSSSGSESDVAARKGPFTGYRDANFTNYGSGAGAGTDGFKNYSPDVNIAGDSFRRYGRDSSARADSFSTYEANGNVVTANFTSYAGGATGGSGSFTSYAANTNVPESRFTNYDAGANGRSRGFTSYSPEANSGESSFSGYGKSGNSLRETFTSYGNDTNTLSSGFANYGESANGATDTFTGYGVEGNVPENTFRSYGAGGNAGVDTFKGYRDGSNVGDDSFASYAKGANGGAAEFESYGGSANAGSVGFKGYGQGTNRNHEIGFKAYAGDNTTFKAYAKTGVDFKEYHNTLAESTTASTSEQQQHQRHATKWSPEPGKFFRERELVAGNRMPMPDIRDKMPPRAFLPRDIARKIPFEASAVSEAFGAPPDTAMGKAVASTVAECERAPSRGETKRCATSAEDVVDFAVEMLGDDIVVRSTASTAGSGAEVRLGDVTGGKAARAVSCHQSLFPYLVYYCHSVPKARVYEADIMAADAGGGRKINRGVAICHLDTSDWSPSHGAFVLLGGEPGKTEVCHWIFEGDMTWTAAD